MLVSFCRKLLQINIKHQTNVHILQTPFLKSISHLSSESGNKPSLTLSYLINSCGFSPESALSAAKSINIKTTQKPDSVLEFFKTHGFSNTQITKVISFRPRYLHASVDKILKPKIKYFQDLGLSQSQITRLIASQPKVLSRSLKTHIIPTIDFHILQTPFLKSISHLSSESGNKPSLTLSYLINSCGFSPESALSAAESINIKTTQKPDSVLEFFKTHGFSNTQITSLISFRPRYLHAAVDKTLKPKIKYFQDLGLSQSQITRLIASNPSVLTRSLKTHIIPTIDFLRNLVQTNENAIKAFRRSTWMVTVDIRKRMLPNIAILKEYGIPDSQITDVVTRKPIILLQKKDFLREVVRRVEELGFERGSGLFVMAMFALCELKKSTWEAKFELFKSLGWSENEILDAFRRMPMFVKISEKKIRAGMDFYVNKLKWQPSELANDPILLMFSLEERLIPRSMVWKTLKCKELVNEGELKRMLRLTENQFLRKYVTKYEKQVPYLLNAYKGELEFGWSDSKGEVDVNSKSIR